jgi:predicted CXXCH cytochrome family protein
MAVRTRHFLPGRRVRAIAIWAALSILTLGCSVRKNYKTLSFFFDGVPDPNAPVARAAGPSGPGVPTYSYEVVAKMYQHKPYAEGNCAACHTADKKHLVTVKAELCLKCHAPATTQYATMHAPVALGQCLWCHEPHESDSPKLLKTTSAQLCLQCHDQALLPSDIKPHLSDRANCLYCHVGHGGPKPSLLLADNPTITRLADRLMPSTQPAPDDSAPAGGTP